MATLAPTVWGQGNIGQTSDFGPWTSDLGPWTAAFSATGDGQMLPELITDGWPEENPGRIARSTLGSRDGPKAKTGAAGRIVPTLRKPLGVGQPVI